MADLRTNFAGIQSPNPFWLASGPPTNTYGQVAKAFDQGWGGAVWKTIGEPIINVFSRYGSVDLGQNRMMGFNNIELITDRPIAENLKEIAEVKRNYPKHAVIASLMVESKREAWHTIVKQTEDTGADGIELNFGCPHGMSERGMGSAVGQVPDYTCQIVEWVKEVATIPVIVKLTPNVTDITYIARDVGDVGCELHDHRDRGDFLYPFDDLAGVIGHLAHGAPHAPLAHPVRAPEVELDPVRARVLGLLHHLVPRLLLRFDHERRDYGVLRIIPLHLGDLFEVLGDGPVTDQLDVVEAHHAVLAEVYRAVTGEDIDDRLTDRFPD